VTGVGSHVASVLLALHLPGHGLPGVGGVRDDPAMVNIGATILNVSDRHRASAFWSQALGYQADPDNSDFLFDPSGKGVRLHLDETDRSHLDLWAEPGQSQAEVNRLLALGATKPDWVYPEGADFVVLADTEGNLFCVIGD
jgi:hypothetical protein